ncbi:EthD domain-containing protein [Nocardia sp. NBC_00508]|uniref:EthD domain-containing protein n=1 Tax=Nocardia sp. NBC_00508 TaxID=2975992 RepID=UPI002E7FFE9D|nr:EthD domain-containing protein [Nocardia sp. NBC_00508]WUD67027.1 EthD domain-containing protein [Nocardia sp. NBC_00508]
MRFECAVLASHAPEAAADTTPDPVKLVCALRRRPDLLPAQFYDYWLHRHGPFATEQIKVLGGYRYVQSHTTDSTHNLLLATARGTGEAFDGVTEVWFRSEQALITAMATPAGMQTNQRLADDEKNFIDLPRSSYFLTKEHVMLG